MAHLLLYFKTKGAPIMSKVKHEYTENKKQIKILANRLCDDTIDAHKEFLIVKRLADCVQEHIQILKKGTSEYCIAEYYVDYNDFGYFHYYEPIGSVTLGEALEYITNLDSNCYDADIRRVTQDEYNDFYDLQELTKIRTCINSLTNTDGDFIEFSKRVDNAIESMREKLGLMNPWDTIKID